MELFSIQCTTCRARLKVKDESAVGSILNCPRCGSMVQVIPPVGWQPSGDPTTAAAAPGSLSVADSAPRIPAAASSPVAPEARAAPTQAPPELPSRAEASVPAEPPAAAPVETTSPAAAHAEPPATMPPETAHTANWASEAAARLRADGLLWAGGLSAGALVGAMIWFVAGRATVAPQVDVARAEPASAANAKPDIAKPEPTPAPTAAEPAPTVAAKAPPAAPAQQDDAEQASADDTLVADAADPQPQPTASASATETTPPKTAAAPIAAVPKTDEDPAAAAPVTSNSELAPAESPKPALRLDPAAAPTMSPSSLDPLVESILGPATASDSDASTGDADALADEPLDNPPPDEPAAAALSQDDVDSAMAVELSEVKFVGVTLAQFVEFVGDVTALKISVDDAALARHGKRRTMPLSVHLRDTTAADALAAALSPLGLTYELRGNRLFVTVPGQ